MSTALIFSGRVLPAYQAIRPHRHEAKVTS